MQEYCKEKDNVDRIKKKLRKLSGERDFIEDKIELLEEDLEAFTTTLARLHESLSCTLYKMKLLKKKIEKN